MSKARWTPWEQKHVVDVRDAAFAARTYLEHRDLRALLDSALGGGRVEMCRIGRSVETSQCLFAPLELLETRACGESRPTYERRPDVGTYMAFRAPLA